MRTGVRERREVRGKGVRMLKKEQRQRNNDVEVMGRKIRERWYRDERE